MPETNTDALVGDKLTEGNGVKATGAFADLVVSATLIAAMITPAVGEVEGGTTTMLPEGNAPGAVYKPSAVIVPTFELPPAIPLTVQVTPVFDVPLTVAENCFVCKSCTDALEGRTVTMIGGGTTVTVALADTDESTVLITDTVTEAGDGTTAGAVYIPVEEIVPKVALPPSIPLMSHVTPDLEGVTLVVN